LLKYIVDNYFGRVYTFLREDINMRLALVALLALISAKVAAAEERPLQPVTRPADIPGETRCLPYFVAITHTGNRIIFWYKASDGSIKRENISKSQSVTYVSEESRTPTYEKDSVEGYQDGAIFRLSRADYQKSRLCVKEPTPEPAKAP
jgi:hypothetical protein